MSACPTCGYADGVSVTHGHVDARTAYEEFRCPRCHALLDYQERRLDPVSGRWVP